MRTIEFISYLRGVGIELSAEGGRLRCRASRGVLTPELKSEIANRKDEIIAAMKAAARGDATPIPRIPRSGGIPLSFAQERLWIVDQLEEGVTPYRTQIALRILGPLDADALEKSLRGMIARHEVLRTIFELRDGQPMQIISPPGTVGVRRIDLSRLGPREREDKVRGIQQEEISHRFDLKRGPLIRPLIVRLGKEEHVLFVTIHHIIFDGWSVGILLKELSKLYRGFSSGSAPPPQDLPIQYADFAAWQRFRLQGDMLDEDLAYWRRRLDGISTLNIETDHPRPRVPSYRGSSMLFDVPASVRASLASLCREWGVTPFTILLAAFQTLLHRYSGQNDIAVGSAIAGRNRVEIEGLIGMFASTLVLRTDLSGDPPFIELMDRVRATVTEAFEHQEAPFEKLVEVLHPDRDMSRHPLFQVMLVYQNVPMQPVELPGLTVEPIDAELGTIPFDLTLGFVETNQGIKGSIEYSTDLFDSGTIDRMSAHLQVLLEGIVRDPERRISTLPMITEAERHTVLCEWNDPSAEYRGDACIHELFERRVEQSPDATAIAGEGCHLTYRELDRRANRLTHHLRSLGVGPETFAGIYLARSIETVIAMLAALKAGAAYVPLDPSYPSERISFMIEDAGITVVVTTEFLSRALSEPPLRIVRIDADREAIARENDERPVPRASSRSLAYVIYTSGSTGRPKGVLVEHGGVCNCAEAQIEAYGVGPADRVLQFASPSFDASVSEMFMALLSGATLCVEPSDSTLPGDPLATILRERDITIVTLPSSSLALMPTGPFPVLGTLIVAGEAFAPDVISAWMAGRKVINAYGPTEATICATHARCRVGDNPVPIGRPIRNAQAYILDRSLEPLPPGVPGELYVQGPGVARCYHGRPSRTAECFLPDPFSASPGRRMYRTGDMTRYRSDGEIVFLGRVDSQVKIRGFRIEPGEIEAILRQMPAVREAVVGARKDGTGENRLAAYIVPADGESPSPRELRRHLEAKLPSFMIPDIYATLEQRPLTPSGKIDRQALPMPDLTRAAAEEPFVAPRTPIEEILAGLFADVLGIDRVGVNDDFFLLGGHSLLATKLASRIRKYLDLELPLGRIFEAPTVAGIARIVEELSRGEPVPAIAAVGRERPLPLSFAQERLWFIQQLAPQSAAYNLIAVHRLTGVLDPMVLDRSIGEIARRHESFRTTFGMVDGEPVQIVSPEASVRLRFTDLRETPEGDRRGRAMGLVEEEARRPFDLAAGPLLRALLLQVGVDEHIFAVCMHHIVSDGWSMEVFFRELAACYGAFAAGGRPELPALPCQYADFAVWQRARLGGDALESQLTRWRRQLDGLPAALELPADHARPPVQSMNGSHLSFRIPARIASALGALGREEGATSFMTLLAAFGVLLFRYTHQSDIVIGSPIAGRSCSETEELVGFFVNTLPLRADLSRDPSFRELLRRVRGVAIEAYSNQDVPFEKLVEVLHLDRDTSRNPIFQVMFALQSGGPGSQVLPGLSSDPLPVETGTSKFDLMLGIEERQEGMEGSFEYSTDLFERDTIARMAEWFVNLLGGIAADPDRSIAALPFLADHERRMLTEEWNDTEREYPRERRLDELFELQADSNPDRVAVVCEDRTITYGEFNRRANELAGRLVERGVRPEDAVGICLRRPDEVILAALGILKAGAAYVPLDPDHPEARLRFIVQDVRLRTVVTEPGLSSLFDDAAEQPGTSPLHIISPDADRERSVTAAAPELPITCGPENLAYIIYTSGSTGVPKGVCCNHTGVVNLLAAYDRMAPLSAGDHCSVWRRPWFDVSVYEIFSPLVSGATLDVVPEEIRLDVERYIEWHVEHQIAVAAVPTVMLEDLASWLAGGGAFPALRRLHVGSEPIDEQLLVSIAKESPGLTVINEYGPTETTICATLYPAPANSRREGRAPIGKPFQNTAIYILDERLEPVPIGVPGELYIAGPGLSRCYCGRADLTAERFIPNPFQRAPAGRLYRTGDIARYLPDGNIMFIGRSDSQVKIRGYRIELEEIEAALRRHPAIRSCAVAALEGENPRQMALVSFYVSVEPLSSLALRRFLRGLLPAYMVPAEFRPVDAIPRTSSGKIDYRRLKRTAIRRCEETQAPAPPESGAERAVAAIWRDVLNVTQVGLDDNFFDLGGYSMIVIKAIARIKEKLGVALTMVDFIRLTLRQMACICEGRKESGKRNK